MKIIIIVDIVITLTTKLKMSMLMKLNFILTQPPSTKKQNLLEQILPLLYEEVIQGKLSAIWINAINNDNDDDDDDDDDDFITIHENKQIHINITSNAGKTLLTKIIRFIINRPKEQRQFLFFIILKNENINIRKLLLNHNKNISNSLFTFMMRSFIVINQQLYENIFQ